MMRNWLVIIENKTGVFFDAQNPDAIVKTLQSFDSSKFDPAACRAQAEKFSTEVFKKNILSALNFNN
jgi:hypothetical protein